MSLVSGYGISLLSNPYAEITIDVPNLLIGKPQLLRQCIKQNDCFDEELMRADGVKDAMASNILTYRLSQTKTSSLK